jgi:chromate reductase
VTCCWSRVRCEAVLIATPEYNGSIPGGLKNAVDWASRPFPDNPWRDKPVAVIGASTGIFGAVWAQAELRESLGSAGASVIDAELAEVVGRNSVTGTHQGEYMGLPPR